MSVREHFERAERLYETGYWYEAETHFRKVIQACDAKQQPSRSYVRRRSDAVARLYVIASALHREDDADIWAGMLG